jgi:di/tricarboxylate transporter
VNFAFYYTAVLLVIMTVLLVKEWLEVELTMFCVLLLLIAARVITLNEAFAGFSNEAMLSVGLLYIVAGALENTGALSRVGHFVLGSNHGAVPLKLLRLTVPAAAASAFINNTPLVAMSIPVIRSWAEKNRYALSQFLIPLSYATILGGTCTLIGTSTNLVVQGLLIKNGFQGMAFFEISKVGVPVALAGVLFICLCGRFLLPDRKEPIVELGEKTREFVIELRVTDEYENVTKTIEEAGLRHLTGLFLFQIEREGKIIAPARPEDRIYVGDRLFFTGLPKTILELQKTPGLQLIKDSHFDLKQYDSAEIKTYEAVISASSPLIGKNVRDSNFRTQYGAVIIAIHRNGTRIQKKIGDVVLRPGDTLLLLADNSFFRQWYHSADFYLISSTEPVSSKPRWQARLALLSLLAIVVLTVFNLVPLIAAAGFAVVFLMATRCITPVEVKNQIDWRVLIVIACAIGISGAVTKSGIADILSQAILACNQYCGIIGVLAGLYLITNMYTTFISNNAAAAILFPVALATARQLNADIVPFAVAVAIAASLAFATPIGYQTNLMVYGPGGYKFKDFIRIGLPLQLIAGMLAIVLLYAVYY